VSEVTNTLSCHKAKSVTQGVRGDKHTLKSQSQKCHSRVSSEGKSWQLFGVSLPQNTDTIQGWVNLKKKEEEEENVQLEE